MVIALVIINLVINLLVLYISITLREEWKMELDKRYYNGR